jgi:threonylcarbamoyladenosine tRNA methylthiotransferase MtaB
MERSVSHAGGPFFAMTDSQSRAIEFHTLGCKLNHYETEAVVGQFRRLGWHTASGDEEPDLVLIDTCTVTDRADQKARQLVRSAIRRNPEALVVVMGCYGQAAADELARIPGVDYVMGNQEKRRLPELISDWSKQEEARILVSRPARANDRELLQLEGFERQTRAYLKIQDGCDVFCSFCIIPFTRGRSRSMMPEDVLEQARKLLGRGFKEFVLTGVHIGDYGRDLAPAKDLAWLCGQLLKLDGLARLRISSIEPWDINNGLLDLMASEERFCPHIHTAIQSGSDRILAAMKRRITRDGLLDLCQRIQARMPSAGLGTDVIVGFPGESAEDFDDTRSLLETGPFTYLHVFPYSERSGTRAASLPDPVSRELRKARSRELLALGEELKSCHLDSLIGTRRKVLLEGREQSGSLFGFTPEYARVEFPLPSGEAAEAYAGKEIELNLLSRVGELLVAGPLA